MVDKYIFIHIPKTAGTSIRTLLTQILGSENISPPFSANLISEEQAIALDSYRIIFGHISYVDVEKYFPDRKLITFLREPVDRCLSVYGFFRQNTDHPLIPLKQITYANDPFEATSIARQLCIDDFFMSRHPHVLQNIENRAVWQLGGSAQFDLREANVDILQRAKNNLECFDFIGLYERLAFDTCKLQNYFGFLCSHALPTLNITDCPVRSKNISELTRKNIVNINDLDLELYNYAISKGLVC